MLSGRINSFKSLVWGRPGMAQHWDKSWHCQAGYFASWANLVAFDAQQIFARCFKHTGVCAACVLASMCSPVKQELPIVVREV